MNSQRIEIFGTPGGVLVGHGLMSGLGEIARSVVDGNRCALIADENSARLFGATVQASLREANFSPVTITVPVGETSKSIAEVDRIGSEMIAAGLDRTSFVIGLGGGVIGDLSGFVAAIFQRGIPHLQVPTTLLAMVDSAIGGKTGVNLPGGKNLLGAIHHPSAIVVDLAALDSLPPREMRQGFAEIIKHGIIGDAAMLDLLRSGEFSIGDLVPRNIAIKAAIVAEDDRETSGRRALLNFGHTIGHAVERAANFQLPHGDCVALGMLAACRISEKRAGLAPSETEKLLALLRQFELPTQMPPVISAEEVLEFATHDKKFSDGEIRFVVTPRFGEAFVSGEVTMADLKDAIEQLRDRSAD